MLCKSTAFEHAPVAGYPAPRSSVVGTSVGVGILSQCFQSLTRFKNVVGHTEEKALAVRAQLYEERAR